MTFIGVKWLKNKKKERVKVTLKKKGVP